MREVVSHFVIGNFISKLAWLPRCGISSALSLPIYEADIISPRDLVIMALL